MCQFNSLHQDNGRGLRNSHCPYAATDVCLKLTSDITAVSQECKSYWCSLGLSGLTLILWNAWLAVGRSAGGFSVQSSIRSLISAGHSSGTCIGSANIVSEGVAVAPQAASMTVALIAPSLRLSALCDRPGQPAAGITIAWRTELSMQHSNTQSLMRVASACSP